jgi:hypothetical protein
MLAVLLALGSALSSDQALAAQQGRADAEDKFRKQRQKLETKEGDTSDDKRSKKSEVAKMKLPKSPIVAHSADQLGKEQAPPKAHVDEGPEQHQLETTKPLFAPGHTLKGDMKCLPQF